MIRTYIFKNNIIELSFGFFDRIVAPTCNTGSAHKSTLDSECKCSCGDKPFQILRSPVPKPHLGPCFFLDELRGHLFSHFNCLLPQFSMRSIRLLPPLGVQPPQSQMQRWPLQTRLGEPAVVQSRPVALE